MKSDIRSKQATPGNPLWEQVMQDLSRFTRRDHWNPRRGGIPAGTKRGADFQLEPIEPRLLMSADLSYAALTSGHDFTLQASNPGGTAQLNLYNTGNTGGPAVASVNLAPAQTTITVERSTSAAQLINADTVRIDLTTFSTLNSLVGAGNGLTISFTGGSNAIKTDHVFLDGNKAGGVATLGYGLSLTSDSDITVDGSSSFGGDVSLKSEQIQNGGAVPGTGLLANANSSIIVNGASLADPGHTLSLTAHSNVTVNDTGIGGKTLSGSVVTSQDTAGVDIGNGSVLTAKNVSITSGIDGSLTASVSDASVAIKVLAVGGYARPEVTVNGGSHITADNTLSVKASTDITTSAVAMPDAAHPNTDSKVDAADATTVFENTSAVSASGGAQLTGTGGAVTLLASDKLTATTTADASVGSAAGATLASSIITGDTTASIDGATVKGTAVSVEADTSRTITTHAMASSGGADSSAGGDNGSEKALKDNKAATSDGNLTVAGAVAVGVDTGTTSAFLKNATVNAGPTGAASVVAGSLDKVDLNANGSFTGSGSTGVGVGAAVGTAVRSDLATVTGATDDVTAGSLTVKTVPVNGAQSSFGAQSTSGVGNSSKVGIAGSLALNISIFDHQATLDTGTALTMHGTAPAVTFAATDSVANVAKAEPSDGGGVAGKVGIGASVAFNYQQDTTYGLLGDSSSLAGAGNLTLTADSTHNAQTDAHGGGAGGTAVTPVVAITVADDDAKTKLGTGGVLTLGGSLSASSALNDTVNTTTEGDTKSGKTGVGISLSLSVVNDTSTSTTVRNVLAASGAASFLSSAISGSQSAAKASVAGGQQDDGTNKPGGANDQKLDDKSSGQMSFADKSASDHAGAAKPGATTKGSEGAKSPSASSSDGAISVAGAFAVNVAQASSAAYLDGGVSVTTGGQLALKSAANVDGAASADGSAVQGQIQFNPAGAGIVDLAGDTITLGTATGLKTGDSVTYDHGDGTDIGGLTNDQEYFVADAGGGKFKFYDTATNANAKGAAGLVDLNAAGTGTTQSFKGAGPGGTSVGVAVAVDYGNASNLAYLGNATVSAGSLDIEAGQATQTLKFDPTAAGIVDTAKNTVNAGETNLHSGDAVIYGNGGGTSVGGLTSGDTYYVNVQADGTLKLYDTGEDAAANGTAGLVTLAAGATGSAHSFTEATNAFAADATSGAGGGKTGVAGAAAINLGFTDTEAVLGYNGTAPTVTLTGGTGATTLKATSDTEDDATALPTDGGADGSSVGVGISVAFNYAQNQTLAQLANGVTPTGMSTFDLEAESGSAVRTQATGGASGSTAVTPVISVAVVDNDTDATIGTGGLLTTTGTVTGKATLTDQVLTSTKGDTKSDSTGVGISLSVSVVNDNALATTGRNLATGTGGVDFEATAVSGSQSTAKASVMGGESDDGNNDQKADKKSDDQKSFADGETKGTKSSAKGTEGAKNPSASTSDGSVSVAGAFAVNIELASAKAYIGDGISVTAGGTLTLKAATNVDGAASADGSAVLSALKFDPTTAVSTTANTIDLGKDSKLKTGDVVTYNHGDGGTDIGGLTSGTDYYVYVVKGGVVQLYDTKDHATAHGGASKGLVALTSVGTGTAHTVRGAGTTGTAVGVAIGIDYAKNTNLAYVGATLNSSAISAGGLDIEATQAERQLAFDAAGGVNVTAGTIALGDTNLRTGDGVVYHAAGGTAVGGLEDGKGYFASIGADGRVTLYESRDDAEAGGTDGKVALTAAGTGMQHFSDVTSVSDADSTSGAGGGKTGVAGSVAINVAMNDSEAVLGRYDTTQAGLTAPHVTVTGGGAVKLAAEDTETSTARALPSNGGGSGSNVGVGISVAVDYEQGTTLAKIADGAVLSGTLGSLSLSATSDADMTTDAKSGAKGSTAVVPVVSIAITNNDTDATVGTGAAISLTGNFDAKAELKDQATTTAKGDVESDDTGVGISIAVSVVNDNALATTGRNLSSTAGTVSFDASATSGSESSAEASVKGGEEDDSKGDQSVDSTTQKQSDFGSSKSKENNSEAKGSGGAKTDKADTSDGGVSVAGAVAINIQNASAQAYVPAAVTVGSHGLLSVKSATNVDGAAIASGAASTSGSGVGVGVGVSVNVANNTNLAYIAKTATVTAGGLDVEAGMTDRDLDATVKAIPVVSLHSATEKPDTIFVGMGTGWKTGDDVTYATNGGTAIGGLTDGHTYYVATGEGGRVQLYDTKAHAQAGGATGLVHLTATGSGTGQTLSHGPLPIPVLQTAVPIDPASTVELLNFGGDSHIHTGDAVHYAAGGGAAYGGLADGKTYYAIEVSEGLFQLAATRDDAMDGKAIALTGAGNPQQKFTDETNSSRADATSGGGGGKIGVAGSVAVNVVSNDSEAVIGRGGAATVTITGSGPVTVSATDNAEAVAKASPSAGGASGTNVGVGASVALNVLSDTAAATITDGTAWSGTAGAFTVSAVTDAYALTHGENGASSGSVAIGVGVAVLVVHDTTQAYIGTGSDILASGDISVTAAHTSEFQTETDAKAAGQSVGVGASISVGVQIESTAVEIARNLSTTAGSFTATSTSDVTDQVKATASSSGDSSDDKGKSKNDSSKSGADGQADHEVNDNATTKGGDTTLASSSDSTTKASGDSKSEGGSGSSGVGVAASVAVNVVKTTNTVTVSHGADLGATGAVALGAVGFLSAASKAIGSSIGISTSGQSQNVNIGAGIALNVVSATNKATVGSGSRVSGNGISITAQTPVGKTNEIVAWGASAGGSGGNVGAAGSVAINVITTFDTEAVAAQGSVLDSTGAITVKADTSLDIQTLAAAGAFSKGTSVGLSVAIGYATINAVATIGGTADAAGAITVEASAKLAPTKIDLPFLSAADDPSATSIAVAGAATTGNAAIGASAIVNVFTIDATASIGAGAQINQTRHDAGQSLSVTATTDVSITSIAGALSLSTGTAGIGAGVDVEVIGTNTKAFIGTGATVSDAGTADIEATGTITMLSIAAVLSAADEAAVAVTASIPVVTSDTEAYLADAATGGPPNLLRSGRPRHDQS